MPGAGTDKTRNWVEAPGPVIILVEPQLGENIGAAAPRDGQFRARAAAARQAARRLAQHPARNARPRAPTASSTRPRCSTTSTAAIADCTVVLATTARAHDQAKPVLGPDEAAALAGAARGRAARTWRVLFGRERYGLENHEVALADRIVTLPVNPAFASLNLAQAVAHRRLRVVQACVRRRAAVRHAAEIGAGRQASRCRRSSPISSASSTRRVFSDRWTSAPPCWSTCATSSRACSRPSRTSRPCTASWWR